MTRKMWWTVVCVWMASSPAWAGSQFEAVRASCVEINCGGMEIRGIHQTSEPFLIQVFAAAGECLRLDVLDQTEDMALLLVAPAVNYGGISDDRDVGDFRPLFGLDPVPWTGWYTVAVSYFDYDNRKGRFTLNYGRYKGGNANCLPPPATAVQQLKSLSVVPTKVVSPAANSN